MKKLYYLVLAALLIAGCNSTDPKLSISIDQSEINSPATGGKYTVSVTAEDAWSAATDNEWITFEPASGNAGTQSVTIAVAANKGTEETAGKIVFTCGKEKVELPVKRAGRDRIKVSTQSIYSPAEGGEYTIEVTTQVSWQVNSDASWVTFNPGVGKENGSITVNVSAAETPQTSRAILTISEYGKDASSENKVEIGIVRTGLDVPLFSVSGTKSVMFSSGNLQYNPATKEWRFAENQWDIIGDGNKNISDPMYSGWLDLFGWGTGNRPTLYYTDLDDYEDHKGKDWGENNISNAPYCPTEWRTMQEKEWQYLFFDRANAENLFAFATVNSVEGIIVLPDKWQAVEGVTFVPSISKNISFKHVGDDRWYESDSDCFSHNIYTTADWEKMESSGAIFLPAAGEREGDVVNKTHPWGKYWSWDPNAHGEYYGVALDFMNGWLKPGTTEPGYKGFAIRLVLMKE